MNRDYKNNYSEEREDIVVGRNAVIETIKSDIGEIKSDIIILTAKVDS